MNFIFLSVPIFCRNVTSVVGRGRIQTTPSMRNWRTGESVSIIPILADSTTHFISNGLSYISRFSFNQLGFLKRIRHKPLTNFVVYVKVDPATWPTSYGMLAVNNCATFEKWLFSSTWKNMKNRYNTIFIFQGKREKKNCVNRLFLSFYPKRWRDCVT